MSEVISLALLGGLLIAVLVLQVQIYRQSRLEPPTKALVPQLSSLAISAAQQSVWDWNMATGFFKLGSPLARQLGYDENSFDGTEDNWAESKWIALLHNDDRSLCLASFERLRRYKNNTFRMEFRLRHLEGRYLWVELNATMLGDRCIGLASDITARKRAEHALHQSTIYDNLTTLPNRALLLDRLAQKRASVSLALLDIIGFRALNDQFGERAGDNLLLMVAERLKAQISLLQGASLARVGADEFALLAPTEAMPNLLDKVGESLRAPFSLNDHELKLRFAFGWAASADVVKNEALMEAAGIAMQVSRERKQVVQFHSTMRSTDSRKLALEGDLDKALARNEIEVHYQPIMQIADTKVWGFEALMRWRHPRFGLVSPAEFIPLAEEHGLINALGLFVLNQATKQLAQWQLIYHYTPPLFVSVNVSRHELLSDALVENVRAAIRKNFLKRGQLKLEITESLLIDYTESVRQLLHQLRASGAEIAIDDFGTGYSSLGLLQHLPFDVIKLDRTLIDEKFIKKDDKTNAIIEAVVAMARSMQVQVVAEGTDSSEKAFWLQETGCDYAQGFFYAHPMEADKVLSFLPRNRPR